ncbi:SDR family NAD(P)-dependent oxidoreductase, partial [Streptomyces sp. SID10244]|nr:SDR family NAD(P)-dependent oxidoreductase [Streptomyces sp. SID10244]
MTSTLMDLVQRRSLLPGVVEDVLAGPGRDITGLTIVVTGASAGIGRQASTLLAERGARVIAVARREDELRSLAGETGCSYRTCDLSDEKAIETLVA